MSEDRRRVTGADAVTDDESRIAYARLQGILDANLLGFAVSRPDGSVAEANDYYLDLLGYTREDLDRGAVDWRATHATGVDGRR